MNGNDPNAIWTMAIDQALPVVTRALVSVGALSSAVLANMLGPYALNINFAPQEWMLEWATPFAHSGTAAKSNAVALILVLVAAFLGIWMVWSVIRAVQRLMVLVISTLFKLALIGGILAVLVMFLTATEDIASDPGSGASSEYAYVFRKPPRM